MSRADVSLRPFVRSLHAVGLAFFVVDRCASALAVARTAFTGGPTSECRFAGSFPSTGKVA